MFYSRRENRRKRWYNRLAFGQKKLMALAAFASFLVLSGIAVFGYYSYRAQAFDLNRIVSGSGEILLYDEENALIGPLSDDGHQYTRWDELPPHLIDAFVAREDESFFEHSGVVYSSVVRALIHNIRARRNKEGASTITMQLTRNAFELSDKTLDRKMLEAALAKRVERHYNKQTIFTQYVNRIYYGENCYGIAEAASHYFGKQVKDLSLVECATLVGLVRSPSRFNPCKSMDAAMKVKKETLNRMLELGSISQQQHADALAAPIELRPHGGAADAAVGGSYASVWANNELENLREKLGENAGGLAVSSTLRLPVQQYTEKAMERALHAVETMGTFPAEWEVFLGGRPEVTPAMRKKNTPENRKAIEELERFEAQIRRFTTARRPEGLRSRMQANDLRELLQCCVLVLDTRSRRRGNVLAVVGGRSVADGVDRWQGMLRPGRVADPLVFCCTCLPGKETHHLVDYNAEGTGKRLGYDVVRSFLEGLKMDLKLPSREQEKDLYTGHYDMKRQQLAEILFSLMHDGYGHRMSLISRIWSRNRVAIYSHEREAAREFILREGARTVSVRAPFHASARKPTVLNETLADGTGQFCMVCSEEGVCTFVWMGFDSPSHPAATAPELQRLVPRASLYLAREIHDYTSSLLQAEAEERKKAEKERKQKLEKKEV